MVGGRRSEVGTMILTKSQREDGKIVSVVRTSEQGSGARACRAMTRKVDYLVDTRYWPSDQSMRKSLELTILGSCALTLPS